MKLTLKSFILLHFGIIPGFFLLAQNKPGFVDVSVKNIQKNNVYLYEGWEFYSDKHYSSEEFAKGVSQKPEHVKLPHLWNQKEEGNLSSGKGFGTYRIWITGLQKGQMYALNINRVQSSYNLFVDGKLIHSVGIPGVDKKSSKPGWSSDDIFFTPQNNQTEIIIQVSNFYHKKGGIENEIVFGTADNIYQKANSLSGLTVFLIGILLIMAAYHMGMYFFKRNDTSNLWFALAMISTGLFSVTVSEIILVKLIPSINWQLLVKTNYIANYLRLLFFVLFIYQTFKKHLNKSFVKIITYAVLVNVVFVLLAPAAIFTQTLIIFLVITSISLVFILIGQIKAVIKKQPGALISFFGIVALLLTVTNDFLKETQVINTISLTTFGLFIFIIFNSYLISITNSHSYRSIKKLTQNLILHGKIKNALFDSDSYSLKAPLKAVADAINTDRAVIFIFRNNNWIATNEYIREDNVIKELNISVFSSKENVYFSSGIVKKAVASREPTYIIVNDAEKAKYHEYLEDSKIASVLAYPLIKDNLVQSLLYFENNEFKPKFEEHSLEILKSLVPHISVFMNNLTAYNQLNFKNIELEENVAKVTAQIENRSNELRLIRTEIEKQNSSIEETSNKLQIQNQSINDGVRYAKKIQTAFLNNEKAFKETFPESFILNKPAGVLSGDFYKFERISDHESIIVVADSGAQDITGALMSFIGAEILNTIVTERQMKSPKLILNEMQEMIFKRIKGEHEAVSFDVSVLYHDTEKNEMVFSGARHSIYHAGKNELIEYKSTAASIGFNDITGGKDEKRFFSNRRISVSTGDILYLFTDGYEKQISKTFNDQLRQNKFKELLISVRREDLKKQFEILESELIKSKNESVQSDDILIIALKIK
jgi:serine phosphatase RsbU (regulator of sigma subunit)